MEGPYAQVLRKAANTWQPVDTFHLVLKGIMLNDLEHYPRPPFYDDKITQAVTRTCVQLEAWLQHYRPLPNKVAASVDRRIGISLVEFFAVYRGANNWTLQKAVTRCATGQHREALRQAAQAWWPGGHFHHMLKRIMINGESASPCGPLTRNQITPAVTRIRKQLEMWLCDHYPQSKGNRNG